MENQINPNPKFHVLYLKKSVVWNVAEYIPEYRQAGNTYTSIDRVYRPSHDFHPCSWPHVYCWVESIKPNSGLAALNNCVQIKSLNARSAVNKAPIIRDVISINSLDILVNIETWYSTDMPPAITDRIALPGYSVLHRVRDSFHYLWKFPTKICREFVNHFG